MRPASIQPAADPFDPPLRRRVATMALVILLHVLLVLVLTRLAENMPPQFGSAFKPLTVDLLPEEKAERAQARQAKKTERTATKAHQSPAPAPPAAQPQIKPPPVTSDAWSQVIPLTSQQLASADISKMPSHAKEAGSGDSGGSGNGRDTAGQPGAGPHGETLYAADWYRRPTNAELDTYLPRTPPREGWGEIACRTAPAFHVEDCVELGQSPQGSGFGRAVREAAWQFLVRPPRVGGKTLVGEWVRIRIDYTEGHVEAR